MRTLYNSDERARHERSSMKHIVPSIDLDSDKVDGWKELWVVAHMGTDGLHGGWRRWRSAWQIAVGGSIVPHS